MSGTMAAIISGTVLLIALFLILTKQNGSGMNAFGNVINSLGGQYVNVIKAFQG